MRLLSPLLFALTLFAQASSPRDLSRGVNFYSLEKEIALGGQIANDYRAQATLIDSPELLARVEALARKLIPEDSRYRYSFALVDDKLLLNEPVAFPGGFVFVPSGLILAARDTDELCGMLAHAIAHIESRHGTKQATKEQIANQAAVPLIFMGGWTGFATRRDNALAIPLGMLKFHRALELDADLAAARLMRSQGYDPGRLANYIERVQPPDSDPPEARSPLPPRAQRVEALRPLSVPDTSGDVRELQQLLRQSIPEKATNPPRLAR